MSSDPYLLWADFETTGLPEDGGTVPLEAAFYLTDQAGTGFKDGAVIEALVAIESHENPRLWPKPVLEMHTRSGLLTDVLLRKPSVPVVAVESKVLELLDRLIGPDAKVALAGAGVGHAELAVWIPGWMPRLHERCVYWPFDMSVVRRFLAASGFDVPPSTAAAHRARADIAEALRTYRHWRQVVRQLGSDAFLLPDPGRDPLTEHAPLAATRDAVKG